MFVYLPVCLSYISLKQANSNSIFFHKQIMQLSFNRIVARSIQKTNIQRLIFLYYEMLDEKLAHFSPLYKSNIKVHTNGSTVHPFKGIFFTYFAIERSIKGVMLN